ncbi:DinB family protein [Flavobacterium sp. CYK-55]|uniref:DinB family protein n=1 Tax=Flavobacterium sp. CYK-55 TaxID=2835529 RepID=UPI001BCD7163|nr:DinB family protein [Flavobacterium sp. CYK-55]MBS7786076.1 DinB family protein [Flavobacterium sp. CYK-55]
MNTAFEINRTSRNVLLSFLDNYSLEQLNKIPDGFSNNLIWNIGHIVVVQQMLVYKLSGLPMMVTDEMVEKYRKGTKPEGDVDADEVAQIRALLFKTIEQTQADYQSGKFSGTTFNGFTSMSGFTMNSTEDAIAFNNYHEAVHTGIMMGIRKFI